MMPEVATHPEALDTLYKIRSLLEPVTAYLVNYFLKVYYNSATTWWPFDYFQKAMVGHVPRLEIPLIVVQCLFIS